MVSNNELKIGYKNGLGINKFEFEINCKRLNQADSSIRTKEHIQVSDGIDARKNYDFI